MRRAGALAAALMLLVAGCGGSAGDDGKVALRVLWWGSDTRHRMTQEMIAEFEKTHPNIDVQPEFTGWNDYWDRLATNTAGGDMPDIVQHDADYLREYAERGALLDLGEYMPGVIDPSKLDESVLRTGEVEGKTYAIPTGVNAYSIVADPAVFQQAGVAMPDDRTWTWQQFIDTAAQITRNTPDGVYGLQDVGFVDAGIKVFARQRGESLYGEEGELGVSDKTLRDWFQLIVNARDSGAEPPPSRSVEVHAGNVDQSLTATRSGALGAWWTNQFPTLAELNGRDLRLLRFPGESERPGMYLKPGMFWTVSAETEHPEAAAEFINWMVNDPRPAEIQLTDRGLPINTEVREHIVSQLSPADQQARRFLEEVTPDLSQPPKLPPPGSPEVQDILVQINQAVLFNRMTPAQAAENFRTQANSAIN
ncbi:extracellular solute-binding protein [Saccharopolyspora halophila]|uniref:Extracellular solute-binding protein n=1 Tax=Saccharopolyspora halophila TaxID=405551 RepID=A0ABN3GSC0_9PSEU